MNNYIFLEIENLKTIEKFGYSIYDAKSYAKIVVLCRECNSFRNIQKRIYRNICRKCSFTKNLAIGRENRRPMSEDQKEKLKLALKKYHSHPNKPKFNMSTEARKKISLSKMGKKNPNFKRNYSLEERQKISERLKKNPPRLGKIAAHGKYSIYINKKKYINTYAVNMGNKNS